MATLDPWTPIEGRCNSRRTGGTGLCRNEAGKGTDHLGHGQCYKHGGSTRNGRTHGARLRAMGEVGALLAECEVEVAGRTETEAMIDAVLRAKVMVMSLGRLIEDMPIRSQWHWEDITGPEGGVVAQRIVVEDAGLYGPDNKGDQKPHVLMSLYGEWIDRLGKLLKTSGDLGIREREIALGEQRGALLVAAVRGILADVAEVLGVDVMGLPELGEIVRRHAMRANALEVGAG